MNGAHNLWVLVWQYRCALADLQLSSTCLEQNLFPSFFPTTSTLIASYFLLIPIRSKSLSLFFFFLTIGSRVWRRRRSFKQQHSRVERNSLLWPGRERSSNEVKSNAQRWRPFRVKIFCREYLTKLRTSGLLHGNKTGGRWSSRYWYCEQVCATCRQCEELSLIHI